MHDVAVQRWAYFLWLARGCPWGDTSVIGFRQRLSSNTNVIKCDERQFAGQRFTCGNRLDVREDGMRSSGLQQNSMCSDIGVALS